MITAADYGTFGLFWILLNLFFLFSLIGGGVMLTRWVARRAKRNRQKVRQFVRYNDTKGKDRVAAN